MDQLVKIWSKYRVIHQFRGPRIALGLMWWISITGCLYFSDFWLLMLFSATAAIAALQTSAHWRAAGVDVNQLLTGAGTFVVCISMFWGHRVFGILLLIYLVALFVLDDQFRPDIGQLDADGLRRRIPEVSVALRCSLFPIVVALSAIALWRIDVFAFLVCAVLVSVFDASDFLIGAGYDKPFAGPIAAAASLMSLSFVLWQLEPEPFTGSSVMLIGLACVVLCPLGQMLASWTLPNSDDRSPALRRIDSWLIAAPTIWVVASLSL